MKSISVYTLDVVNISLLVLNPDIIVHPIRTIRAAHQGPTVTMFNFSITE